MASDTVVFLSIVSVVISACLIYFSYIIVEEGHVGVVYYLGSLSAGILNPGFHLIVPFISRPYSVQVTVQTDSVRNVPCGTKSGVTIYFDKIEVVNQLNVLHVYQTVKNYTINYDQNLIFDKIHHEMNQFCSKHTFQEVYIDLFPDIDEYLMHTLQASLNQYAPGVSIRTIRLTKPNVPENIQKEYSKIVENQSQENRIKSENQRVLTEMAAENQKKQTAMKYESEQKLTQMEAQKAQEIARLEADRQKELARIKATHEQEMSNLEAETSKKQTEIENQAIINKKIFERDLALQQAEQSIQQLKSETGKKARITELELIHLQNMNDATYKKALYTQEYSKVKVAEFLADALRSNTKVFYGDKLPSFFNAGGIFSGLFNGTTM
jgi:regulator of protease activity HflC (stomatin/prohibitin superfamily)